MSITLSELEVGIFYMCICQIINTFNLSLHYKNNYYFFLDNVSVTHNIQFEQQKKADKMFWKVKSYTVEMQPEKISFKFDNLFNGNEALSDRIHSVVNENWQALWLDSKKDFEETYGKIYLELAQRIFSKIPVENIFGS